MSKINLLFNYIIDNLMQIRFSLVISGGVSVVTFNLSNSLNAWLHESIDYVFIALLFIAADHVFGSIVHYFIKKDFNWQLNIVGFAMKLGLVVGVGILFEALAHLVKDGDMLYTYLKMVGRLIVCIYPLRSALMNVKIISKGKFPPDALIGKMDDFNKDLDLKHFKNKEE
ncbi:hypothetical protein [Flavobacterium sp. HSC-61S13]|uniref:hypothetical protein n=1 Tax=Flavobacterium sp. HSC-61S13 TaxID=2910963 RepID=UPI00209D3470|nr:hypothetical protein [Flavobacterium sp. HSC-61S13]MCP1996663.1 hypothetical protein [Flavobacterium sp. HSC-61S13]